MVYLWWYIWEVVLIEKQSSLTLGHINCEFNILTYFSAVLFLCIFSPFPVKSKIQVIILLKKICPKPMVNLFYYTHEMSCGGIILYMGVWMQCEVASQWNISGSTINESIWPNSNSRIVPDKTDGLIWCALNGTISLIWRTLSIKRRGRHFGLLHQI